MTKRAALQSAFLVDGADLSGDIGALGTIEITRTLQDVTGLDKSGTERIALRSDGQMAYDGFWNTDAGASVPVLRELPDTNVIATYLSGRSVGDWGASLVGKKTNFNVTRGQDGSIGLSGVVMGGAGSRLEWGRLLTLGAQAFGATQAIDEWTADTAYAEDDLVVPTTPNGHYYQATVAGTSDDTTEPTWPTNGTTVVDDGVTWQDMGLLPNGIDRGVGSASDFGLAVYVHILSIGAGSVTVTIEDSGDRVAWAPVIATAAPLTTAGAVRLQTDVDENVRRYVRAVLTGTFTDLVAAVVVVPYRTQQ